MAEISVSEFVSLINQQITSREELNASISKANSLVNVALSSDLTELPEITIHEYLWALNDFIERSLEKNGEEIGVLVRFLKTLSYCMKGSDNQ